jgi:hypothetical protein
MGRGYEPLSTEDWNKLMRANVVARVIPKGMAVPGLGGQDFNGETPISSPTPTPSITPTQTITPTPTLTPTITPTSTITPTPTPSSQPISVDYITRVIDDFSDTTPPYQYTFNSVDIGGPGLIVLTIDSTPQDFPQVSSVIIGGITASFQQLGHAGNFPKTNITLAYARITSGTTADIVVNFGSSVNNCSVGVWRIQNNTSDTPYQVKSYQTFSSGTYTLSFTSLPTNSVGIVGLITSTAPTTFTNATLEYNYGAYFTAPGGGNLTISNSYSTMGGAARALGMAWS